MSLTQQSCQWVSAQVLLKRYHWVLNFGPRIWAAVSRWTNPKGCKPKEVHDNILSLGKLVKKSYNLTLGWHGCSVEKDGRSVPLYLERNGLRVKAHVLQRVSRPVYVAAGTAVADEHMEGADVQESQARSLGCKPIRHHSLVPRIL